MAPGHPTKPRQSPPSFLGSLWLWVRYVSPNSLVGFSWQIPWGTGNARVVLSVALSWCLSFTHPSIPQAHVSKGASVQSCPSVGGPSHTPRAQIPGGQAEGGPGLSGGQGTSVRTPRPSVRRFLHCALTVPAWGSPFSCLRKPAPPLSHLRLPSLFLDRP